MAEETNQPNVGTQSTEDVSQEHSQASGTTASEQSSGTTASPNEDLNTNYRKYLPEELRKEKIFESVPDLSTLAKNYKEAQTLISKTRAMPTPPKPDAPDADWQAFHQKIGAYDSPEKYTVDLPEIEGVNWDDSKLGQFKDIAHSAGLTQRQVSSITKWFSQDLQEQMATMQERAVQEAEAAEQLLKKEWGGERLFTRNIGRVDALLNKMLTAEDRQHLEGKGIGRDPVFLKMMHRLAAQTIEDSAIASSAKGWMTKEEAESKKWEIMRSEAYRKGDEKLVQEVLQLNQYLYDNK